MYYKIVYDSNQQRYTLPSPPYRRGGYHLPGINMDDTNMVEKRGDGPVIIKCSLPDFSGQVAELTPALTLTDELTTLVTKLDSYITHNNDKDLFDYMYDGIYTLSPSLCPGDSDLTPLSPEIPSSPEAETAEALPYNRMRALMTQSIVDARAKLTHSPSPPLQSYAPLTPPKKIKGVGNGGLGKTHKVPPIARATPYPPPTSTLSVAPSFTPIPIPPPMVAMPGPITPLPNLNAPWEVEVKVTQKEPVPAGRVGGREAVVVARPTFLDTGMWTGQEITIKVKY